jgi:hypothetical protein
MAVPANRAEFKAYCLRRLGAPVTLINLDDTQIDDRIDEALWFFHHNHYNGSEHVYIPVQITAPIAAAKVIELPVETYGDIIGITRVFRVGTNNMNLLSIDFAVSNQAMWQALQGNGMLDYAMLMQYRSLIEEMTVGEKFIRFNELQRRVYVDLNYSLLGVNQFIVFDATKAVDPVDFPGIWADKWLQEYATQLIKRNWGEVLKKYSGVQLPGGITMDGKTIYEEAQNKIEDMEEKVKNDYTLPCDMQIG